MPIRSIEQQSTVVIEALEARNEYARQDAEGITPEYGSTRAEILAGKRPHCYCRRPAQVPCDGALHAALSVEPVQGAGCRTPHPSGLSPQDLAEFRLESARRAMEGGDESAAKALLGGKLPGKE